MLAADEWCVRGGMTVFISPPPPWLNKENGNQLALHLFWEIFSRERICLSKVRAGVTVAYQRHSTKARTHIRYDAKEQLFCFHLRPYKHTENRVCRETPLLFRCPFPSWCCYFSPSEVCCGADGADVGGIYQTIASLCPESLFIQRWKCEISSFAHSKLSIIFFVH